MNNIEMLGLVLTVMALGQSLLAANILALRRNFLDVRLPLILFFAANALTEISSTPALFDFEKISIEHAIQMIGLPATLLLAPAIWKYVYALTSEDPARYRVRDTLHLIPFFLGIIVCLFLAGLSEDVRDGIIGDSDATSSRAVAIATAFLIGVLLLHVSQLVLYSVAITLRLFHYSIRLQDLYANLDNRELTWLIWMLLLLFFNVIWSIYTTFFSIDRQLELIGDIGNLMLIWMLSIWGLRQCPGLRPMPLENDVYGRRDNAKSLENGHSEKQKYGKSALSDEQIIQIAEKLDCAMRDAQLYMNPNLSLRDLSTHISTYPNYVSQTLNARLKATFFDYVNGWRIREALPRLRDSNEQVTNIAYDVGFNSRSSFYSAFKKETGQTPTQYRSRCANG